MGIRLIFNPQHIHLTLAGHTHLYVSRGFGFLAYPGRVGIWPEVTEITLEKG